MRYRALIVLALSGLALQSERRFAPTQIDGGAAESAAVADFNNDGKLDIVSAESWYEAPRWTKRPIRTIPVSSGYIDSFSDLPLDVDGDGFTDVIQIGYFARRIVWMKNPGTSGGAWTEHLIDAIGPTEFAFLVDLDNDGKADDLLPQFNTAGGAADVVRPSEWRVGETHRQPAELRSRHRRRRHERRQAQRHPDAARLAGSARRSARAGRLDVSRDRLAAANHPRAGAAASAVAHHAAGDGGSARCCGSGRGCPAPGSAVPRLRARRGVGIPLRPRHQRRRPQRRADDQRAQLRDLLVRAARGRRVAAARHRPLVVARARVRARRHQRRRPAGPGDRASDSSRATSRRRATTTRLGIYWYEFRRGANNAVTWTRHTIDYGSKAGGGMQMAVRDIDGDGDMDVVSAGKSGLFLAENLDRRPK